MPADPDFVNEVENLEKAQEETQEPEAKEIFPMKNINRGQDTLASPDSDNVVFADFSPIVLPSHVAEEMLGVRSEEVAEDEDEEPAPKEESAPEPVLSEDSQTSDAPTPSETTASKPAKKVDGQPSQSESG